jgi:transcriptional regulator with XRE-family HTH domain
MPRQQTEDTPGKRTPFAIWLDSVVVPTLFANDAALARAMGVPQTYVYRWRRGVTPQVPALAKLAKATGTSIETLLRIAGYESEGGNA